jgi:hypothetical protein
MFARLASAECKALNLFMGLVILKLIVALVQEKVRFLMG